MHDLMNQLIEKKACTEEQIANAEKAAAKKGDVWLSVLCKDEGVDQSKLSLVLGDAFGYPVFDLSSYDKNLVVTHLLSSTIVTKQLGVPLFEDEHIIALGVCDPTTEYAAELAFSTGKTIEYIIVRRDQMLELLKLAQNGGVDAWANETDESEEFEGFDSVDFSVYEEEDEGASEIDVNDTPVVKFVNKILIDAIRSATSDIHIEPYEQLYRVRYRQDGILYEVAKPPLQLSNAIVARLKVMSNLDISERRIPQDGRFKLNLTKQKSVDFRISTCPTLYGEKVVMRILDSQGAQLDTADLGFEQRQTELYSEAINSSHGMILVTGPTGSGKTVTLYNGLNTLNCPERNISTIEDPVEINMEGVNQVQVNTKTGMTFSGALRSFLRQDPDVIMLGEIRDLETAEIAIKAAQTGHLVLSTLHTNSAPETLTRLVNMGVQSFNIASSVNLVMAQRLVRQLCKHCKKEINIPDKALLEAGFTQEEVNAGVVLYEPNGCDQCSQGKGYKGRIGIYEMMPITQELGRLIMDGGNAMQILDLAVSQGMNTLRRSGLNKAKMGLTSLAEINRVVTL